MENKEEKKNWRIYAGLSGGFGGAEYIKTINSTEQEAEQEACLYAEEKYESYGLFNYVDAKEEEPELTEGELDEMYREDMENWIDYYVVEETEENKNEEE